VGRGHGSARNRRVAHACLQVADVHLAGPAGPAEDVHTNGRHMRLIGESRATSAGEAGHLAVPGREDPVPARHPGGRGCGKLRTRPRHLHLPGLHPSSHYHRGRGLERVANSGAGRVLPMPGSPTNITSRPWPDKASSSAACSAAISRWRPTKMPPRAAPGPQLMVPCSRLFHLLAMPDPGIDYIVNSSAARVICSFSDQPAAAAWSTAPFRNSVTWGTTSCPAREVWPWSRPGKDTKVALGRCCMHSLAPA
jgi:hypothetical protein